MSSCSPPAGTCCAARRSSTGAPTASGRASSARRTIAATARPCCCTTADLRTVLLTRQFRYPVYVNDHPDGMLIETAAGLLDDDDPATAIRREAAEETGVEIGELEHVYDVYMSPGSVTERIHFFAAPYDAASRTGDRRRTRGRGRGHRGPRGRLRRVARDDPRRPHPGCEGDHAAAVGGDRRAVRPVTRGARGKLRLSANPAEPGYPCYVSVLGELAWMPPRGELRQV